MRVSAILILIVTVLGCTQNKKDNHKPEIQHKFSMVRGNDTILFAGLYEEDFHGTLGHYKFLRWTGKEYTPDPNAANKFSITEKDSNKGVFVLSLLKDTFYFRDTISSVFKKKDGVWLITQVGEYDVSFEMNYRISETDSPSVSQLDIPALGTVWHMRKE